MSKKKIDKKLDEQQKPQKSKQKAFINNALKLFDKSMEFLGKFDLFELFFLTLLIGGIVCGFIHGINNGTIDIDTNDTPNIIIFYNTADTAIKPHNFLEEKDLIYDENTKIIYIKTRTYGLNYAYLPYYSENGNLCRYVDGKIVEVTESEQK